MVLVKYLLLNRYLVSAGKDLRYLMNMRRRAIESGSPLFKLTTKDYITRVVDQKEEFESIILLRTGDCKFCDDAEHSLQEASLAYYQEKKEHVFFYIIDVDSDFARAHQISSVPHLIHASLENPIMNNGTVISISQGSINLRTDELLSQINAKTKVLIHSYSEKVFQNLKMGLFFTGIILLPFTVVALRESCRFRAALAVLVQFIATSGVLWNIMNSRKVYDPSKTGLAAIFSRSKFSQFIAEGIIISGLQVLSGLMLLLVVSFSEGGRVYPKILNLLKMSALIATFFCVILVSLCFGMKFPWSTRMSMFPDPHLKWGPIRVDRENIL